MPITRYQIRNEYSLADPELYRAADKDDPEALLEGVAMAGLVGVLRQLGDLAEFAAEIFHDLHEEVLATAARGHGLMVRVQQLEAEVPSIEKAFLSRTSHSQFIYNRGVDWHPNLRMDQNLVSRGDLPRFVMDSYEECRGPPRLFLLDKFDIAGAGACLKRFSDPSFFKAELTSSESKKAEIQRDKRARKVKKKGSRWRNGETPEALPVPHTKLHQLLLEERRQTENNAPGHRAKLKKRQSNQFPFGSTTGKSYMEKFVEMHSPECKIVCESSLTYTNLQMASKETSELVPEIHEIGTADPPYKLLQGKRSLVMSHIKQEKELEPSMKELHEDAVERGILKKLPEPITYTEIEKIPYTFYKPQDQKESSENEKEPVVDMGRKLEAIGDGYRSDDILYTFYKPQDHKESSENEKEHVVDMGEKLEANGDGYRSDDITSEVDNYMDALATMESEMETDTESKTKKERGIFSIERQGIDSDTNEEQLELQNQFLDSHSVGESSSSDNGKTSFRKGRSSFSNLDTLSTSANNAPSDGDVAAKVYPSIDTCLGERADVSSKMFSVDGDSLAIESSENVIRNGSCNEVSEVPSYKSEFSQRSSSSVTDQSQLSINLGELHLQQPELDEISYDSLKAGTKGSSIDTFLAGLADVSSKKHGNDLEIKSSENMILNGSCNELSDVPSYKPEFGQASSSSVTDSASISSHLSINLTELHLQGPESDEISSDCLKAGTKGSSSTIEDDRKNSIMDLSCPTNVSDLSSEVRDSFLHLGSAKGEPVEELDGVKNDFLHSVSDKKQLMEELDGGALGRSPAASLNLSYISNLAPEREDNGTSFEEVHPTGYPEDGSTENLDSQNSVILPTEEQVHDLVGHDLEANIDTVQPEYLPCTTCDDLEDVNPESKVVETDTVVLLTGKNSRYCEDSSAGSSDSPYAVLPTEEHFEGLSGGDVEASACSAPLEHACTTLEHLPASIAAGSVEIAESDVDRVTLSTAVNSEYLKPELYILSDAESDIPRIGHFVEDDVLERKIKVPPLELVQEADGKDHSEVKMNSNNLEEQPSTCDIMLKDEARLDVPGSTDWVPSVESDQEKYGNEHSYVKTSSNNLELLSDTSDIRIKDEPRSGMVHLSPCDSMGISALCLGIPSICDVPSSPKPALNETHLDDLTTETVHAETDGYDDADKDDAVSEAVHADINDYDDDDVHPNLIGSPSSNQIKLQEEYICNGNSEQSELEVTEACGTKHILEPDDQKEVNQLEIITEDLKFEHCRMEFHDTYSSELTASAHDSLKSNNLSSTSESLDVHDHALLVEHATSNLYLNDGLCAPTPSNKTNQECEPKPTNQRNLSESAEDVIPSSTSLLPEGGIPSEQVLELQVDKPSIDSSHDGENSRSSYLQCEQTQSPNHIDYNGCFTVPSESSSVDSFNQYTEPVLSPQPTTQNFNMSKQAMDPLDSILPSFGMFVEATHQKLLQQHPSGPAMDFPVPDPNALQSKLEMPPLPPLPPIQWRMGKYRNSPLTLEGAMIQSSFNPFLTPIAATSEEQANEGFPTLREGLTLPSNPFLSSPVNEDEKPQHGDEMSGGEIVQSSLNPFSSQLVTVDDENSKHGFQTFEQKMSNLNPFLPLPSPDDEKPQHSLALGGELGQPSLNPFTSPSPIEDVNSGHACISLQGEPTEPLKLLVAKQNIEDEMPQQSSLSPGRASLHLDSSVLPVTIPDEKPQHGSFSLEGEMTWPVSTSTQLPKVGDGKVNGKLMEPLNLSAAKPNIEDEMLQQNSLSPGRGASQNLDSSVLPMASDVEKLHNGSFSSEGEMMWPMSTSAQLPNLEDWRINGKPWRQPRPRNPLIEAVASHDKSMLRKVTERVRSLIEPKKDERDSLLEQIRTKSFNLKPAVTTKPSIQGPKTNLNVAAILEKANAIRQALAGSDEDDDDWSDS
ncbi:PREDICTED: uncharacterized protein LOC104597241 [Nelumbo nucifera]|uniref:Uncharacterized protein LOC104597241 n=1 Tax=Nelumbo nucifera TaxID=4432 RepID=A0A1U7ZXI6_NELNU|nr:PREDICTED: uncharacterized protein LOC104597241 [Nelumbo nucifera]